MPVLLPNLIAQDAPPAFPDGDLELTCRAAFGADLAAGPETWEWTDLSSRVIDAPITVTRGVLVGGRSSRTASASVALLNDDGQLTAHHPASDWWPYVDAGTPMDVHVRYRTAPILADTFSRTFTDGFGTSDTGAVWLGGTLTAFSVSAGRATISLSATNVLRLHRVPAVHRDVDAAVDVTPTVMSAGASVLAGMAVRGASASTYLLARLEFTTGGVVRLQLRQVISNAGTDLTDIPTGLTYAARTTLRLRVLAVGQRIRIKVWTAASAEPGAWTLDWTLPDGTLTSGVQAGLAAAAVTGYSLPLPATVHFDNLHLTQPHYPLIEGYIADIKPTFQPTADGGMHSVAVIDVGGVGTRLERLSADDWSPLRRSIQRAAIVPHGYWPLEDAERSTSAASAIPGQPAMTASGPVVWDFDLGVPEEAQLQKYGTKNIASLAAGAQLSVQVVPSAVTSVWTVSVATDVFAREVSPPVTEIRVAEWETAGGTFTRWALISTATGHQVRAYNDNLGTTSNVVTFADNFAVWMFYDVSAVQNGGNIDVTLRMNSVVMASGSVAGTMGAVTRVDLNPDQANTTGSTSPFGIRFTVGHLVVRTAAVTALPVYFHDGNPLFATEGWYEEPAHLRAQRLCEEERIPFRLAAEPTDDGVTLLNSQQEGAFVDLTKNAVEAESGGLLYEDGFGYALLPRSARYNRPVDLTVDLATYQHTGDTSPTEVLAPQLDVRAPTIWTVQRTGGSQALWAASEVFRKRRGDVAASATLDVLSDADTLPHAQWRTHLTEDAQGAHYPGAVVDLTANPGLLDDWVLCSVGSRIQRTNQPTIAGLGVIDQVVEGVSETVARRSWTASIDGAPANVWDVGGYDDTAWLTDSSSTTLVGAHPATTVGVSESWQITTVHAGDVWATSTVPYTWSLNGEDVTVTAMGAASGSGPYVQTATVTRGANGVVKPHQAGDQVHLAKPVRWAL